MRPEPISITNDRLGECPLWDPAEGVLYWLDLLEAKLHRLDPATGRQDTRPLTGSPPFGALLRGAEPGRLVIGGESGLEMLDFDTGRRTVVAHPIRHLPHLAYNDGKVDHAGRLFLGTLDREESAPRALLFMLDGAGEQVADAGFVVCNGPAFSPDNRIVYFSDSIAATILAYDLDADGKLLGRRVFARFGEEEGLPDGLTVDRDGGLWVAHWGGSRLTRFAPGGERDLVVPFPVPNVTACAFGGRDFATLYVTTAHEGLTAQQRADAPLAGSLFSVQTGFAGLPEPVWGRLT